MKDEKAIRELLELRIKEYKAAQKLRIRIDVNERGIKDLLWILEDSEFEAW